MQLNKEYPHLYNSWCGAKSRCRNPNNKDYARYGGRGVKFSSEWEHFKPFLEWAISSGWKDGLTLDRIDPNGDYEPSNCRWATVKEQNNNRRNNYFLTVNGKTRSCRYWSDLIGIPHTTVSYWIAKYGEDVAISKISSAMSNGYGGKPYAKGMRLYCTTNDTEYNSLRDAAKRLSLERTKLAKCVRTNTPYDGYEFVAID